MVMVDEKKHAAPDRYGVGFMALDMHYQTYASTK